MAVNNCTVGIAVGIRIIWIVSSDSGVGIDICVNIPVVFNGNLVESVPVLVLLSMENAVFTQLVNAGAEFLKAWNIQFTGGIMGSEILFPFGWPFLQGLTTTIRSTGLNKNSAKFAFIFDVQLLLNEIPAVVIRMEGS